MYQCLSVLLIIIIVLGGLGVLVATLEIIMGVTPGSKDSLFRIGRIKK